MCSRNMCYDQKRLELILRHVYENIGNRCAPKLTGGEYSNVQFKLNVLRPRNGANSTDHRLIACRCSQAERAPIGQLVLVQFSGTGRIEDEIEHDGGVRIARASHREQVQMSRTRNRQVGREC